LFPTGNIDGIMVGTRYSAAWKKRPSALGYRLKGLMGWPSVMRNSRADQA